MIDVRYFSGFFPTLPPEFLAQLDDNMRKLSRTFPVNREYVDATSANQVFQLPDGRLQNLEYHVIKIDATANTVTITPATGQTVLGSATYVLTLQYDSAWMGYNRRTDDWFFL